MVAALAIGGAVHVVATCPEMLGFWIACTLIHSRTSETFASICHA